MYGIVRTTVRQAACRRVPIGCLVTVCALVGILLVPSTARAQAVTGTLLGNVTDSSGAGVPGATVTALEVQTNTSRTAVTNEAGNYIFSSLRNGTYTVNAEIQGFKKVERPNVKVEVNTTVRVDMKLEVGQINETLTVSAESPLLQTDRTDTGRILESKMVSELPLTFNRNFQSLLITVPGVTRPHREHSQFFNSQDSLRFEVNGQPGMASNTLIEGLDDNQKTGLLQVIIPAADALETVSVATSNYDAEFGRSGGAVTNVTLKSGTNDLKGSGFFFGNNNSTNASDYLTHLKAPTKFVNGGFTLGGPIVKNKLFFFGDYQRTIDNNGYVVRATVPTAKMRNGDFSEVSNGIYDPATGDGDRRGTDGLCEQPDSAGPDQPDRPQAAWGSFRLPNIAGATFGQNNFQQAQTREKTTDGFDTKVSYTATAKDQVSFRLSFMRPVVFDPGLYGQYGGPANGGFAGSGTNTSYSGAGTWTRVFSAKTVLDVRGGLNYYHNVTSTTAQRADDEHGRRDSRREHRRVHERALADQHRRLLGSGARVLGQPAVGPLGEDLELQRRVDQAVAVAHREGRWRVPPQRRHAAADAGCRRTARPVRLQLLRHRQPRRRGVDHRASPTRSRRSCSTGRTPCSATSRSSTEPGTKHTGLFAFVQDKWQARSNVTVDLGLRWEYYTPLAGPRGGGQPVQLRSGDAHAARLGIRRHRRRAEREEEVHATSRRAPACPGASTRRTSCVRDTAPARFRSRTTATRSTTRSSRPTRGPRSTGSSRPGRWPPASRRRRCSTIPSNGIIPVSGALTNATFDVIPNDLHEATLHSWNVAYQRQLPYLLTADIAYVGNRGVDIVMDVDTNASLIYGSGNNGRPQFATAFNRTGTSRTRTNPNKSQLQRPAGQGRSPLPERVPADQLVHAEPLVRLRERERRRSRTPIDFEQSWARSNFDRLHNYTLTGLYELPWGPNKRWLKRGPARQVHRRLAGERPLRRAVRRAAQHHRQRHDAEHAGQHTRLRRTSMARTRCSAASARATCTSTRRSTRSRQRACRAT